MVRCGSLLSALAVLTAAETDAKVWRLHAEEPEDDDDSRPSEADADYWSGFNNAVGSDAAADATARASGNIT